MVGGYVEPRGRRRLRGDGLDVERHRLERLGLERRWLGRIRLGGGSLERLRLEQFRLELTEARRQ